MQEIAGCYGGYCCDVCMVPRYKGCLGELQIIEHWQLQMRGFRMFMGVGRYHPRTALGMEMGVLYTCNVGGQNQMYAILHSI